MFNVTSFNVFLYWHFRERTRWCASCCNCWTVAKVWSMDWRVPSASAWLRQRSPGWRKKAVSLKVCRHCILLCIWTLHWWGPADHPTKVTEITRDLFASEIWYFHLPDSFEKVDFPSTNVPEVWLDCPILLQSIRKWSAVLSCCPPFLAVVPLVDSILGKF